jgi:ubiquinone/menaquinone biosynthesis C-methylase UbiE
MQAVSQLNQMSRILKENGTVEISDWNKVMSGLLKKAS